MNDEELDAQITIQEEQKHIAHLAGLIDYSRYLEYKENAISGMMTFGDAFVEALGITLSEANDREAVKIIRTWRNECSTHEMLWKMHKAKQIAVDFDRQRQDAALMDHEL